MKKYIYMSIFIFVLLLVALSPNTGADKTYLPLIHNNIPLSFVPAKVVGKLVDNDSQPVLNTIVRLAEVWCENYDTKEDCVVLLDLANDPGACTDSNGNYSMLVKDWYLVNVGGWILISGDIVGGDYKIHYSSYDDIIEVYSGQVYDAGTKVTHVNSNICGLGEQMTLDKIIKIW